MANERITQTMTKLSSKRKTGEIARATLMEYEREFNFNDNPSKRVDHLLGWLYMRGFVVTGQPSQPPARRGKKVTPAPSPWLGKSHTQRLIG